jgi:hypothetical protein
MFSGREEEILGCLKDIFRREGQDDLVDRHPADCLIIFLKAIEDDLEGKRSMWPGTSPSSNLVRRAVAQAYCTLDEEHLAWEKELKQEQLAERKTSRGRK